MILVRSYFKSVKKNLLRSKLISQLKRVTTTTFWTQEPLHVEWIKCEACSIDAIALTKDGSSVAIVGSCLIGKSSKETASRSEKVHKFKNYKQAWVFSK